jgi:hypothetical protein
MEVAVAPSRSLEDQSLQSLSSLVENEQEYYQCLLILKMVLITSLLWVIVIFLGFDRTLIFRSMRSEVKLILPQDFVEPLLSALYDSPILSKDEIYSIFNPAIMDQLLAFHSNLLTELQTLLKCKSVDGVGALFVKQVCTFNLYISSAALILPLNSTSQIFRICKQSFIGIYAYLEIVRRSEVVQRDRREHKCFR